MSLRKSISARQQKFPLKSVGERAAPPVFRQILSKIPAFCRPEGARQKLSTTPSTKQMFWWITLFICCLRRNSGRVFRSYPQFFGDFIHLSRIISSGFPQKRATFTEFRTKFYCLSRAFMHNSLQLSTFSPCGKTATKSKRESPSFGLPYFVCVLFAF